MDTVCVAEPQVAMTLHMMCSYLEPSCVSCWLASPGGPIVFDPVQARFPLDADKRRETRVDAKALYASVLVVVLRTVLIGSCKKTPP